MNLLQVAMAFFGSIGFALLFGVRGRKLFIIGIGGALGWLVYLLCRAGDLSIFVSMFAAALFVEILSSELAIRIKTPVTVLQIPMLIPLVPGGDLYDTMYSLISQEFSIFGQYSNRVLIETGAIVLGIVLGANIMRIKLICQERMRDAALSLEKPAEK